MIVHQKPRIPFYYWPFWMFLLAVGLIVFYGIFTPAWILIRFADWAGETVLSRQAGSRSASA